jgi:hypothetical protein
MPNYQTPVTKKPASLFLRIVLGRCSACEAVLLEPLQKIVLLLFIRALDQDQVLFGRPSLRLGRQILLDLGVAPGSRFPKFADRFLVGPGQRL